MNRLQNKVLKLIICLSLLTGSLYAQTYAWPLDSPLIITGNYGELRPNHFHAGLDFSTGGKLNQSVYATASGYISRIKISSVGYGKSIYVTHPNGVTSVYAHLNSFVKKIADLVVNTQYQNKSFEIDINLKPTDLIVSQKELLGFSGNTGNSTAPHLHFELRGENRDTF
jgi:murein DD-endopeptidase MepM/ murein hydrolase activator NlpD